MLVAIIGAFAVLIGNRPTAEIWFSLALVLLMIFALYVVQVDELVGEEHALRAERRRNSRIGWALSL